MYVHVCLVGPNPVGTKTFPSARPYPTLAFVAVYVRLWDRHECYSFHVFTMAITRIAAAYAIATVLRCNHFPPSCQPLNYGDSN